MKTIEISVKESAYFSHHDEHHFYEGLHKIDGFKNISGSLEQINMEFDAVLSDDALRELLSLFARYNLDMRALAVFLSDSNRSWFLEKPLVYWHKHVWASSPMDFSLREGNSTQLVFCSPKVDPDEVTRILKIKPFFAIKVGETLSKHGGFISSSHLGIWKFVLSNLNPHDAVESQLASWVDFLAKKSIEFNQFKVLGYQPYLDCKAAVGTLSLCVAPELLIRLGELNLSLSLGLHE